VRVSGANKQLPEQLQTAGCPVFHERDDARQGAAIAFEESVQKLIHGGMSP
jgi:hypothetical protein